MVAMDMRLPVQSKLGKLSGSQEVKYGAKYLYTHTLREWLRLKRGTNKNMT